MTPTREWLCGLAHEPLPRPPVTGGLDAVLLDLNLGDCKGLQGLRQRQRRGDGRGGQADQHPRDHHRHRRDTLISIVASLSSRQLLLLRLSLPLSDKVKHYSAIALHTIKRQPYGSCQLPITRLQNMIISYNKI